MAYYLFPFRLDDDSGDILLNWGQTHLFRQNCKNVTEHVARYVAKQHKNIIDASFFSSSYPCKQEDMYIHTTTTTTCMNVNCEEGKRQME